MAKQVAVLAVNPVNGFGLFQYLETFYENGIDYKVYAVAPTCEIKTNSGITLLADDVVANLRGKEDDFEALVFACGDAIPVFRAHESEPHNVDMMEVIRAFGAKGKIMVGHCAAAMMFDFAGVTAGHRLALHPMAQPAVRLGVATNEQSVVDGNFYTAQTEHTIWTMMPSLVAALKA